MLTILILQSCNDHSADESSKTNHHDTTISNLVLTKNDSVSVKDWRLSEIQRILPQWPDTSLTIGSVKEISANVFSVLCTHSDGVSMTTYLFTFNNRKVKDHELLTDQADQDLSSPLSYEYTEWRESTDNKFVVVTYIESVNDKSVLTKDGEFKTGFDFENVKIKTDSCVTELSILSDGQIKRDTLKK